MSLEEILRFRFGVNDKFTKTNDLESKQEGQHRKHQHLHRNVSSSSSFFFGGKKEDETRMRMVVAVSALWRHSGVACVR